MTEPIREVSPEEYRQMVSSGKVSKQPRDYHKYLPTAAIILVSLIVGFASGMQYQKSKSGGSQNTVANASAQNGFGRFGGARRGAFGTVSAVSTSSITIQNARTGANDTYKITSSTTVSNNGASASVSDIKSGDTVMVRTSSTDASTATTIVINPSFGGGFGPGADTQTQTQTPTSTDTPAPTNTTTTT